MCTTMHVYVCSHCIAHNQTQRLNQSEYAVVADRLVPCKCNHTKPLNSVCFKKEEKKTVFLLPCNVRKANCRDEKQEWYVRTLPNETFFTGELGWENNKQWNTVHRLFSVGL